MFLTGAAFAMAIAAARWLGAEDRHVTAMLPLGAFFYLATAVSIRTQGFAYPLFIGTLWLLAREVRRPTRRAYLVFPMLILWANIPRIGHAGRGDRGDLWPLPAGPPVCRCPLARARRPTRLGLRDRLTALFRRPDAEEKRRILQLAYEQIRAASQDTVDGQIRI